jgi:hypothetical protein
MGHMFIVTVRLRWAEPISPESVRRVHRAVEAAALPGDGLEHVYVHPGTPDAGIVLFLLAPDLSRAEANAAHLIDRAGRGVAVKWEVISCEAELLLPFTEAALPPDD